MKLKALLILLTTSLLTFAQADPTITTEETSKIPDLIDFFDSYSSTNIEENLVKIPTLDIQISLLYSDRKKLSLDSMPDSLYIACTDYCYPTESQRVTSRFGVRGARFHHGIDVGVKYGDTIRAPFSGIVRTATYQRGGYGRYVIIEHDNGLESLMAHFSRTLVEEGQKISAGEPIGLGGSTGRSTGPHLHLEFRILGNTFNPEKLINFETRNIYSSDIEGFYFMTMDETYSHRPQLEEMKRAAYHRVRSGETLSHIARRYGTSIRRICALNGINQNSIIRIGQRIRYR